MKNISKYLGAGLLLFTAACSQTQEGDQYTPNKDDAKAIHFIQSSIQKEFPQDAVQGVINVEIARPGNKGAYKVYLATKDDDYELFSVPAEATIPDGSHSVTVPVEVDLSNFVMGSNYKTTLYISSREARPGDNAAQVAQYSDKVTLSATYELEWETLYRTTGGRRDPPAGNLPLQRVLFGPRFGSGGRKSRGSQYLPAEGLGQRRDVQVRPPRRQHLHRAGAVDRLLQLELQ